MQNSQKKKPKYVQMCALYVLSDGECLERDRERVGYDVQHLDGRPQLAALGGQGPVLVLEGRLQGRIREVLALDQ